MTFVAFVLHSHIVAYLFEFAGKVRIHMVMDSWWLTFPNIIATLTEQYQAA